MGPQARDIALLNEGPTNSGLTMRLASQAACLRFEDLPAEVVEAASQSLLDAIGVAIAGSQEPLAELLAADACEDDARPVATLLGRPTKTSLGQAALVNGASAHALDYDDAHLRAGHPTAPVMPAVLAIGEALHTTGRSLITAFVAGVETSCRIGCLTEPGHYTLGFHTTATLGTFGAAAASANLYGLDAATTAVALGIAGTQAAGLKSVFGTMCKPLHAGRAAQNGLFAARLAKRGFTSRNDILECSQGFAATHGPDRNIEAALVAPARGFHVRDTLFKYHAACYLTHSAIESARKLREIHAIEPASIYRIVVRTNDGAADICNITEPRTGLEAKFSLRLTTAFAFAGLDTSRIEIYSDENTQRPDLVELRDRIQVEFVPYLRNTEGEVEVWLDDGRHLTERCDTGIATSDLAAQRMRIETKFQALVSPVLGMSRTTHLLDLMRDLTGIDNISALTLACSTAPDLGFESREKADGTRISKLPSAIGHR
jgi:2-methylcitrate dehydratase PrpD